MKSRIISPSDFCKAYRLEKCAFRGLFQGITDALCEFFRDHQHQVELIPCCAEQCSTIFIERHSRALEEDDVAWRRFLHVTIGIAGKAELFEISGLAYWMRGCEIRIASRSFWEGALPGDATIFRKHLLESWQRLLAIREKDAYLSEEPEKSVASSACSLALIG